MLSNMTGENLGDDSISGLYEFSTVFLVSTLISTCICIAIVIIVTKTPNLHSTTNVLVCNTCIATIIYSIMSVINLFSFFIESASSDWSCRVQGYFSYSVLTLVVYSYVIQAISRLFWTVFYMHRSLLTYKCHIILIICQVFVSFLMPISTLVTQDIHFHPFRMCLVSVDQKIHVFYLLAVCYIIPVISVIIIYATIYRHTVRSSLTLRQSSHSTKRDLELARNILILLVIYLVSGIPSVIYIILSSIIQSLPNILYIIAIMTTPILVAIEKIVTVVLNKDIRKTMKQRWFVCCRDQVQPYPSINNTTNHKTHRRAVFNIPTVNLQTTEAHEPTLTVIQT